MIYKYQAYDMNQNVAGGTIEAVSEKAAEDALYQAGFKYVLNLRTRPVHRDLRHLLPSLYGLKNEDIVDFSRQLASFMEAGSSLRTSLELLRDQAAKPAMKEVIDGIIEKVESGSSLSQAVKSYPRAFSHSYWQVIQSCEKMGEMEKGLRQMAAYLENRSKITGKIQHALAYPVFVICLAIGVVILLVTTVLPPMLKLFSSFQADLPRITLFALSLLNFILDYKLLILASIILLAGASLAVSRFNSGKRLIDRLILGTPVFGKIVVEHNMGHFCRTAAMLLESGIPLPEIMDITLQTLGGNRVVLQSFSRVRERLVQGEGLARPMAAEKLFPRMMVRMVTVGEQTGTLDTALATLAAYFQEHEEKKIQSLVGMIEPAITVAIGIGIAFIMVSMVLPIYTIINHVR
jgi:type IV pilus assembly protein PilC